MRLSANYYVPSLRSKFEIKVRIHTYNTNEEGSVLKSV